MFKLHVVREGLESGPSLSKIRVFRQSTLSTAAASGLREESVGTRSLFIEGEFEASPAPRNILAISGIRFFNRRTVEMSSAVGLSGKPSGTIFNLTGE